METMGQVPVASFIQGNDSTGLNYAEREKGHRN